MNIINLNDFKKASEGMPNAVFKYKLGKINTIHSLKLPYDAEIISVGLDPFDNLALWAIVDPKEKKEEEHVFLVIGTGLGYELPKGETTEFLGTVVRGILVYHVFEIVR